MAIERITDKAKLIKAIKDFCRNEKSRRDRLFSLAVSCLDHANREGDLVPLSDLYNGLIEAKSADAASLRYWIGIFSTKDVELSEVKMEDGTTALQAKSPSGSKPLITLVMKNGKPEFKKRELTDEEKKRPEDWVLPGNIQVDLAEKNPWWNFAALKVIANKGIPEFKPENDVKSLMRSLAQHAVKADKAGYPALASKYREMIRELGAVSGDPVVNDEGKVEMEILAVNPDLLRKPEASHAKAH